MRSTVRTRRTTRWIKLAILIMAAATAAYAYDTGPPASRTGAPGEGTCTQCHTGTLNSGQGSVSIGGVPDAYTPGEQYTLTVHVTHPDRLRWGFELTALDASDEAAGSFAVANSTTTKIVGGSGSFSGRQYVEQTEAGTFAGQSGGAQWNVKWTAPASDVGQVTFYAAGNAANNDDRDTGDSIYTTSVGTDAGTTSSVPTIVAAGYKNGKITMKSSGSGIKPGATLDVTNGSVTETFAVVANSAGTKWLVKKSARSTPSGLGVDEAWPAGTTVTLVIHNPDGTASDPVPVSR